RLGLGRPKDQRVQGGVDDARLQLRAAAGVVERARDGRPYIGGADFRAADIMVAYGLIMARITRELPEDLANIAAYLERLKARPAYAVAWA
ncbi:MAG: glutathione S-transferase family protein, partial [Polyangiales bacterium]